MQTIQYGASTLIFFLFHLTCRDFKGTESCRLSILPNSLVTVSKISYIPKWEKGYISK